MPVNGLIKKCGLLTYLCCAALWLQAAVFTSSDGQFSIELPAGWGPAAKPAPEAVLSLTKENARLDIKPLPTCHNEACIEQKTQQDLLAVKNKKMQVIANTYTGEEIKRIDFSTGEPLFYINFFTSSNDFSSGYFLVGQQAYSILAKDLSYAQTDLIFSFISPVKDAAAPAAAEPPLEMDVQDSRAYEIESMPAVQEEEILLPAAPLSTVDQKLAAKALAKRLWRRWSLLTPHMPPYIRQLGVGFDICMGLLALYLGLQAFGLLLRACIKPNRTPLPANPHAAYPIKFKRLYGTPSLIFRAKDNQGQILMSLTTRWDSFFLFGGMMLIIAAACLLSGAGILERTHWLPISSFSYNTVYSAVSLIIPLGFLIVICGALWSQLILRQFALYDSKGDKAVYIIQRGYGLGKERYGAYFAKSKDMILLERKRFRVTRHWELLDKDNHILAHIEEEGFFRAILRKTMGHLWGLLRANYRISGIMDSRGSITSTREAFDRFTCQLDKPQAISARYMLVAAMIINIRDRDKWYPWF